MVMVATGPFPRWIRVQPGDARLPVAAASPSSRPTTVVPYSWIPVFGLLSRILYFGAELAWSILPQSDIVVFSFCNSNRIYRITNLRFPRRHQPRELQLAYVSLS